jgi:hypothetical protein
MSRGRQRVHRHRRRAMNRDIATRRSAKLAARAAVHVGNKLARPRRGGA